MSRQLNQELYLPTCACASDSNTSTPAPSPMTKPSRPVSHGRDAFSGSWLRDDSALRHKSARQGLGLGMDSIALRRQAPSGQHSIKDQHYYNNLMNPIPRPA